MHPVCEYRVNLYKNTNVIIRIIYNIYARVSEHKYGAVQLFSNGGKVGRLFIEVCKFNKISYENKKEFEKILSTISVYTLYIETYEIYAVKNRKFEIHRHTCFNPFLSYNINYYSVIISKKCYYDKIYRLKPNCKLCVC